MNMNDASQGEKLLVNSSKRDESLDDNMESKELLVDWGDDGSDSDDDQEEEEEDRGLRLGNK